MRICSFVPGATEVVAALELVDQLVGISHECDFPSPVTRVPVMIEPLAGNINAFSTEIDREVKQLVAAGKPLYRLDEAALRKAQPDLILTQDLCRVCAMTPDQLTRALQFLPQRPQILALNPTTLEEIIHDIERIAKAVDRLGKGQELARSLRHRLDTVHARTVARSPRPRVLCLEWLAPLYTAGHWIPEMVELAGGHSLLASKGMPSHETTWAEVYSVQPDVVLVMPCGYTIARTVEELTRAGQLQNEWRRALDRWPRTYVVDAASYYSRPGPRLVDGVELLAAILHPDPERPLDPLRALPLGPTSFAMDTAP